MQCNGNRAFAINRYRTNDPENSNKCSLSVNLFIAEHLLIVDRHAFYNHHDMHSDTNLQRFLEAQQRNYETALAEIRQGKKRTHWIWYIFPQIQGLGSSETSRYYAIKDINEAINYLEHPVLGTRLITISRVLVQLAGPTANQIFGSPDDMKLRSCMTLFARIPGADSVFQQVLDKYFDAEQDKKTLQILEAENTG